MKENFKWDLENYINWDDIEKKVGFVINNELKEFYSTNLFDDTEFIIDKNNLSKSFNHSNWFKDSEEIRVELIGNKHLDKFPQEFINNFDQIVIYGDDYNKELDIRYIIGYIYDDRGQIGLYFNNTTGEIEWCDFEWGADNWEDNPRGIISKSIKEFLTVLK